MVDPNTRQGKRTPVTLKIKFKSETLDQFIERYAVDVSQGGIFIRTKEPLAVGTQMKFEFQLRDASPLIAGEGTVVWTRENDPSRPAIAPGMGVRFDRLADGSQVILERILAEKAKQAPQRPAPDTTKPPLFTDTPTRVAPAPMQEALLGKDNGQRRRLDDGAHNDSHTPLPKPMPFHSDADEFPDEAFEEATKVRALDELIAQTAEGTDDPARRVNGRGDDVSDRAETVPLGDLHEAPSLPSAPEPVMRPSPRLLDTSPSPRIESGPSLLDSPAKTRLGVEPARARIPTPQSPPLGALGSSMGSVGGSMGGSMGSTGPLGALGPPSGPSMGSPLTPPPGPVGPTMGQLNLEAPPLPSGVRAVAAEHTEPARMPPLRSRNAAPIVIAILVVIAAAAAAVWFLVIRPRQLERNEQAASTASTTPGTPGTATAPSGSGSAAAGSGDVGSGSAAAAAPAEQVDTVVGTSAEGATVEIVGTGQSGPAPLTARLEKGKPYRARVTAHGFATHEVEVKGGEDQRSVQLVAKPRIISIDSDPSGALILLDGNATGHTTPFDIELSTAQAAKKSIRVQLRKTSYRVAERVVDLGKLTEDDTRMIAKLNEHLSALPVTAKDRLGSSTGSAAAAPGKGSDAGSGAQPEGPVTSPGGGTDAPPPATPTPTGSGSAAAPPPPAPAPAPAAGSGSSTEPEPGFVKPPQ